MRFILGSGSPRRKMILEDLLGDVDIIVPDVDESGRPGESPESYVFRVLDEKMSFITAVAGSLSDAVIITSDTIVTIDSVILGKPSSRDEAAGMLRLLSGREHRVLTGIAMSVIEPGLTTSYAEIESTRVKFKLLDDCDIDRYLDMIHYSDKAGSYAIQEKGELVVESVSGSMTNVIGFPLRLFFSMLSVAGIAGKVLHI